MKCKLLQGESDNTSSPCTYKPRRVHGWNEQNNENQKQLKGWLCDLSCLGIHQNSMVQRYQIYQLPDHIGCMLTMDSWKENPTYPDVINPYLRITQFFMHMF